MGQGPIAGVGGTRMCEWMFTDDAVLIDTAGRYTTQDSDSAVDKAGWDAFLSLLKRTRPRQPLNGVIIAIAMTDIAAAPPPERLAHARAIRRRIKELSDQLGVRMPVYAIFTKADLLAGFIGILRRPGPRKARRGLGHDVPAEQNRRRQHRRLRHRIRSAGGAFEPAPGRPVAGRTLARTGASPSPAFPAQVGSLKQPLTEFVQEAFGGTRLDPAPFLRGIYFASGTQEGTPIDRLTGALARGFGIDQQRAPSLRPEAGKSYFLTRLLKDVIFGEAMLVSRDPAAVKRAWMLRLGAAGLAALVALVGAAALIQTRSVEQERDRVGEHRRCGLCRGGEGAAAGSGQRRRLRQSRASARHGARACRSARTCRRPKRNGSLACRRPANSAPAPIRFMPTR